MTRVIPILVILLSLGCGSNKIGPSGVPLPVRIAFGSCILEPNTKIWESIANKRPDLMLFIGDNVYFENVELASKEGLEPLYQKLFFNPGFQRLRELVPTYAIWDDHDFGPNNSDSTFIHAPLSRQLFDSYWGKNSAPVGLEDSIAGIVELPGIRILLTDNRTFRINPGKTNPTMFGEKQIEWLERELREPKAQAVIVASAGQLLSSRHQFEGLFQFPTEQQRLLAAIADSPAEVVVLSGDRHFAEVIERELGNKRVLELTSSPLSARKASGKIPNVQPNRKALYLGSDNFGMLSIENLNGKLSFLAQFFDSSGELLFQVR